MRNITRCFDLSHGLKDVYGKRILNSRILLPALMSTLNEEDVCFLYLHRMTVTDSMNLLRSLSVV